MLLIEDGPYLEGKQLHNGQNNPNSRLIKYTKERVVIKILGTSVDIVSALGVTIIGLYDIRSNRPCQIRIGGFKDPLPFVQVEHRHILSPVYALPQFSTSANPIIVTRFTELNIEVLQHSENAGNREFRVSFGILRTDNMDVWRCSSGEFIARLPFGFGMVSELYEGRLYAKTVRLETGGRHLVFARYKVPEAKTEIMNGLVKAMKNRAVRCAANILPKMFRYCQDMPHTILYSIYCMQYRGPRALRYFAFKYVTCAYRDALKNRRRLTKQCELETSL